MKKQSFLTKRRVMWWIGLLLMSPLLIFLIASERFSKQLLNADSAYLLGRVVVTPHHLVAIGCVLGLACWTWCAFTDPPPWPETKARRKLAHAKFVLVTLYSVLMFAFIALAVFLMAVFATHYRVLTPVGPEGCRVILSMNEGLLGASGRVYVASSAFALLERTDSGWSSDDPGANPLDEGNWDLSWHGDQASLTIWMDSTSRNKSDASHLEAVSCTSR